MSDQSTEEPVLRILHAFKVFLPHRGGIVTTIEMLTSGLSERANTTVLVSQLFGIGRREHWPWGLLLRTGALGEPLAMPLAPTYPLHFWRQAHRAAVVAYHYPFPIVDLSVSIGFPKRTALVVHWHSEIVSQQRTGQLLSPFVRRMLRRADRVIVSTPFHQERSPFLRDLGDRCVVVPFGIDVDAYETLSQKEERMVAELREQLGPFALMVGRLVPYKGVDVLVRAMPHSKGQLVIAGDGPMGEDLRQLARETRVSKRVQFMGDVSWTRLKMLLHASEFVVLPSVSSSETFGIFQLEAMACGKAIVNTDAHPGIGWVARHSCEAITVPHGDPVALAEGMQKLLEDPALAERLGRGGVARVREQFSLNRFLDEIWKVYSRAAAERRSQG
jgi:glycosyltransferase involved in cell wall biosynthesis